MCTRGGVIELKSRNFERGVTQTVTYILSHGGYEGVKNGKNSVMYFVNAPPPPPVLHLYHSYLHIWSSL